MDFFETLQKRYSSRQYAAQPVESRKNRKTAGGGTEGSCRHASLPGLRTDGHI